MDNKQLNNANIENLTELWRRMGARSCPVEGMEKFTLSVGWPKRCWIEAEVEFEDDEMAILASGLDSTPAGFILPVWVDQGPYSGPLESLLVNSGFEITFTQTAMYLDREHYPAIGQSGLDLQPVASEREIQIWTDIAARSFEYEIDMAVVREIVGDPDVQLFTVSIDANPAATMLIFRTGDVIGVHQVGVLAEYRGRGIAHRLMQDCIRLCSQTPARYITLQASVAGKSLYRSLGFKQQFEIYNYHRTVDVK